MRGCALIVPSRTPRQLGQLQFHCGKPPPAAEPRTRTFIPSGARRYDSTSRKPSNPHQDLGKGGQRWVALERKLPGPGLLLRRLAAPDVHRHLKAETQLDKLRLAPRHRSDLLNWCGKTRSEHKRAPRISSGNGPQLIITVKPAPCAGHCGLHPSHSDAPEGPECAEWLRPGPDAGERFGNALARLAG